jgi:hypothetical protein
MMWWCNPVQFDQSINQPPAVLLSRNLKIREEKSEALQLA